MAPDMHSNGVALPKPPPGATAVRVKPHVGGVAFSTIGLAVMVNGFLALEGLASTQWIDEQVGGHFQFLTINGLAAACLTMAFGILADILPSIAIFRVMKRTVLLIALPVSVIVSSIYWSLLTFAPNLIVPAAHDHPASQGNGIDATRPIAPSSSHASPPSFRIPLWIDLSLHAVPVLALLADFFLRERKYKPPVSTYGAVILAGTAAVAYGLWAEYCASYNGTFPYPFLTISPLPVRAAIYVSATGFALLAFWGLNRMHK